MVNLPKRGECKQVVKWRFRKILRNRQKVNKIACVIFDRTDPVCKQKKTFLCKLLIVLEIDKYIKKSEENVLIVSRIERILSKGN